MAEVTWTEDSDKDTILSAGELTEGGDTEEEIDSAHSMSSFFAGSSSQEGSADFDVPEVGHGASKTILCAI